MLSFTPSQEQTMLIDGIRDYALNEMRKVAHEADETRELPLDVVRKGWGFGLLAVGIPEAYGGLNEYSAVTNVLAAEAFAFGDLPIAMAVLAPGLVGLPVLLSGTEDQKRAALPALAEAEPPPFTAALLEPGINFDASALKTTAVRQGEQYMLNGGKCYVPLADQAQQILVYARDGETGKTDGYLVDKGTAGLNIGEREQLMGIRALPTYHVGLSNVCVTANCKLGGDEGTRYERILSHSRVGLAAMAVGVARGAFEYARDYAKTRVQFGVPIASKQAIAFMLAEMAIEVDAARLMTWEAAWKLDQEPHADATAESYLAKEYADKMALYVTDCAVQILGGHGYIREHPVERWLRNARGFATFEGMAII
ncbi:MAG: acyl-CoA dehydrogenase family protein [Aggregatilineales bacterium]